MANLHHIIIALGTNTQHDVFMRKAMALLSTVFPGIRFTNMMWTEPIGMDGPPFRNCLAQAVTSMDMREVERSLKDVETRCGRTREESLRDVIRMDVDLLLYDDERRHEQDWERPYVHQLMEEMKNEKP